ncbi:hypothetical protein ACFSJY_16055 [Thalassotalea euphylliae]|uniref:hypothetical protein n=1 Tax=Thalassotalea euphylliae TaxID=1655234 RepID=UPI003644E056
MSTFETYSSKFDALTPREQYIVFGAGLFVILYLLFTLFVEPDMATISEQKRRVVSLEQSNQTATTSIALFKETLKEDPNQKVERDISRVKSQLEKVDQELLTLTSDLMTPIQMRNALVELLALDRGVSLTAFEVLPPKPLFQGQASKNTEADEEVNEEQMAAVTPASSPEIGLYQHRITITLKGRYDALQRYLKNLESLEWKFFWQNFELKVVEYPNNEVTVTLYSLSTKREFIGV